jgi:hypothetical protein
MLVNHPDAIPDGSFRGLDLDLLATQEYLAGIRPIEAVQDVHQRGLAGAVLAQKAKDFAAAERQRDRIIGNQRAEDLGDAVKPENGVPFPGF